MKRLEVALKNEAHLRQELELDLKEKAMDIDNRGAGDNVFLTICQNISPG